MSPLNRKELNRKNLIARYSFLVLERDIRELESLFNFSASKYFSKLIPTRVKIFMLFIFNLLTL